MGALDNLIADRYVSTKEASAISGIDQASITRWCRSKFFGAKVGGRYIIDRNDLDQFVKKRGNPNFHKPEYQTELARKRRDTRISSQEADEKLNEVACDKPKAACDKPKFGGIMMGRK